MKPITPEEVQVRLNIPDEVIEIVNDLIRETIHKSGHAVVLQEDIVKRIVERLNVSRNDVFDNNWLDFETVYEEAGWDVGYDKPAYNETYPAQFAFYRKSRTSRE